MTEATDVERAEIRRRIVANQSRVKWRHLAVVVIGAFVELLSLTYALMIVRPDRLPPETFDARAVVEIGRPLLPMLAVTYLLGAVIASFGLGRFQWADAFRKLPWVILISIIVAIVGFLSVYVRFGSATTDTGGGGNGGSSRSTASDGRASQKRDRQLGDSLAYALLDEELATSALGCARLEVEATYSRWMKASSCTCRCADGDAHLTLVVRPISARMSLRISALERREQIQYMGRVIERNGSLSLYEGGWSVALLNQELSNTEAATAIVRQAMAKLQDAVAT